MAARWRASGAQVVELLISTEYWISCYSAPGAPPGVFEVLDGVEWAVLPAG
ncbi:unnamed protein product, partial [Prorocentrum cordatum]